MRSRRPAMSSSLDAGTTDTGCFGSAVSSVVVGADAGARSCAAAPELKASSRTSPAARSPWRNRLAKRAETQRSIGIGERPLLAVGPRRTRAALRERFRSRIVRPAARSADRSRDGPGAAQPRERTLRHRRHLDRGREWRGRAVARHLEERRERAAPHRRGHGRGAGEPRDARGRQRLGPGSRRQGDVLLRRRE